MRLAEIHGSEETSGKLVAGEHFPLQRRTARHQQVGIADGEQGVGLDADAGCGEEAVGRHFDDAGELHTVEFVVLRRRERARFGIRAARLNRCLRQQDLTSEGPFGGNFRVSCPRTSPESE